MQHPISIAATSRLAASSNTFLAYRRNHGGAPFAASIIAPPI
jgi:hypothetical protein